MSAIREVPFIEQVLAEMSKTQLGQLKTLVDTNTFDNVASYNLSASSMPSGTKGSVALMYVFASFYHQMPSTDSDKATSILVKQPQTVICFGICLNGKNYALIGIEKDQCKLWTIVNNELYFITQPLSFTELRFEINKAIGVTDTDLIADLNSEDSALDEAVANSAQRNVETGVNSNLKDSIKTIADSERLFKLNAVNNVSALTLLDHVFTIDQSLASNVTVALDGYTAGQSPVKEYSGRFITTSASLTITFPSTITISNGGDDTNITISSSVATLVATGTYEYNVFAGIAIISKVA